MLSIISVGITKCQSQSLVDIPCAGNDAKRVYSAFEAIMETEFSAFSSICLTNITGQNFRQLLHNTYFCTKNARKGDVLVLYFSGHAVSKGGNSLDLCFADYAEDNPWGAVNIEEVYNLTIKLGVRILLILDCCYSGLALQYTPHKGNDSRHCTLTSCDDLDVSVFDGKGSAFTNVLCEAIYDIKSTGDEFSINSLSQRIASLGYNSAMINFGTSHVSDTSFVLKYKSALIRNYGDFAFRFIERLYHSNAAMREAMWYSLFDSPEAVIYNVCESYFRHENTSFHQVPEASWLVRRAIGSIISCLYETKRKKRLINTLLSSCYWQEQCIGLIGARYLIRDSDEIFDFVAEKITDKSIEQIDAVWLANLYMSENKRYNPELFYDTPIIQTSWGTIELYKTMKRAKDAGNDAQAAIKKVVTPEKYNELLKYIALNDNSNSNKLVQQLRKGKVRGRLPEKDKSKYLLSALYGSWRGQINADLGNYFRCERPTTISEQLSQAREFAAVEFKMGILEYLQMHPFYARKFWADIEWSLADSNLWVRREAIKLYKILKMDEEKLMNCLSEDEITPNSHPGLFDLLLELPGPIFEQQLKAHYTHFTENDLSCLRHAMTMEHPVP